jgi:hypothetical protein
MMIRAEDHHLFWSKRKALTALLPYAILQERDGHPEMLDAYLYAAGTSTEPNFTWRHAEKYVNGLFQKASPRAIVLVTIMWWDWLTDKEDLIQRWAAAASAVSYTEDGEVVRSVVDALLHIASECKLLPHIPTETWSWLTKRLHRSSDYSRRCVGTCAHVVKAVQALKDIEILKSYFLLAWSNWRPLGDYGCGLGCPPPRHHSRQYTDSPPARRPRPHAEHLLVRGFLRDVGLNPGGLRGDRDGGPPDGSSSTVGQRSPGVGCRVGVPQIPRPRARRIRSGDHDVSIPNA